MSINSDSEVLERLHCQLQLDAAPDRSTVVPKLPYSLRSLSGPCEEKRTSQDSKRTLNLQPRKQLSEGSNTPRDRARTRATLGRATLSEEGSPSSHGTHDHDPVHSHHKHKQASCAQANHKERQRKPPAARSGHDGPSSHSRPNIDPEKSNDAFNDKAPSLSPTSADARPTTCESTSCLSNLGSNLFKSTLKSRKNVQPIQGFRGDRVGPSVSAMVGTVVSVNKGGQFI